MAKKWEKHKYFFCLVTTPRNLIIFELLLIQEISCYPSLEILAFVEKYRECMWLMKWKITMLKWIKLTLNEVLKIRIKKELIPP